MSTAIEKFTAKKLVIENDIKNLIEQIKALQIRNDSDAEAATVFLVKIKQRYDFIEEKRKEYTKPLNDEVKELNNQAKIWTTPLLAAAEAVKKTLKKYTDDQARKAEEEAQRLREEQAEKDRIEREKIAEAERKAEAARRAGEEARLAAEAAKTKKEREEAQRKQEEARLAAEAENAKALAAQEKIDTAVMPVIEEPSRSIRTAGGMATRKIVWKWELEDQTLAMKTHPELFIVDEKKVRKMIQEGERQIAGFKVYQDSEIAIRK